MKTSPHILIAPNAFKNSLDAESVAAAIAEGLEQSSLQCTYECFPIADGGDGTAELITSKCNGEFVKTVVSDPLGRKIPASFGLIEVGKTAVIEMAAASGLRLLRSDELNPLRATSAGTGELMKHALDAGVRKIIVTMGGSATVDGGSGILSALGIRFLSKDGKNLIQLPDDLKELASVDTSGLDVRIMETELIILCDVDNRLLGVNGAAAVFGPQKGASPEDVKKLEFILEKFSKVALRQTGIDISALKYSGTAGGAAAGLHAFISARLEKGIEYFLQLTKFEKALEAADVVITGEGSIDEQTLQGKGPMGVALMAKQKGKMVIGLAGKIPSPVNIGFQKYFDILLPISEQSLDLKEALASTETNLRATAIKIGNMLKLQAGQ